MKLARSPFFDLKSTIGSSPATFHAPKLAILLASGRAAVMGHDQRSHHQARSHSADRQL
jgi:hypothetical protein